MGRLVMQYTETDDFMLPSHEERSFMSDRWEYKMFSLPYTGNDAEHIVSLNYFGAEGWQLCGVHVTPDTKIMAYWMKRRLS